MTDPAIIAPSAIDHDLLCARCQYNFRSQPATARCPECDLPIADSLAFCRDLRAFFSHPARVALAAALLAIFALWRLIAVFGMPILFNLSFHKLSPTGYMHVVLGVNLCDYLGETALCGAAVALLWNAGPPAARLWPVRTAFALAVLGLVLSALFMTVEAAMALVSSGYSAFAISLVSGTIITVAHQIALVVLQAALWFYFAKTARASRGPRLLLFTHSYFPFATLLHIFRLLAAMLFFFTAATAWIVTFAGASTLAEVSFSLNLFTAIVCAASLGYYPSVIVAMRRVKRMLRSIQSPVPA